MSESKQNKKQKEIKQKLPFFVICDNIRSLENIGSIFRTADALNVNKIFLCGISGKPPIGENQSTFFERKSARPSTQNLSALVSKSALGAEKWIDWEYHAFGWKLVEKLKRDKVFVVVLEQTKKSLLYTKFKPKFPLVLVVGNEIKGISPSILKRADRIIYLPMFGKKESLNVAVSFGIAAYEINKVRTLPS